MPRPLLLLALLALPACQDAGSHHPAADTFDRDTVQTYNIQTREFQQQPPFGANSNR